MTPRIDRARIRRSLALMNVLATAMASTLAAQSRSLELPAPSSVDSPDDVLVLSPFEVSSSKDTGYVARETLAGTRIRTDLKDVGSAIGIVTKEFMQDIGATDSSTLLQYTTNAEVGGTRGTYAGLGNGQTVWDSTPISSNQRIRGLSAGDNTRNFFLSDIPWDSYNVDRIDIQRGPNSILFGLGSPAGIINSSTSSAEFRNQGKAEFRVASYGSTRAALDINQVIVKDTLAVRVDGLWNSQKYQQEQALKKDKRVYGSLRWDPKLFSRDFATSLKFNAERGKISSNMPRTATPYDSITPWFQESSAGGVGNYLVTNPYAIGSNAAATNPWLATISGQQTPTYFINGSTGQVYSINAGYINNGFLKNDGTYAGASNNAVGQTYSDIIFGLAGYKDYAFNAKLPFYNFAQYKNKMLTDPTVFDFYKNLIDGDNKGESSDWNTFNVSLSQTGWKDRVGLELAFDYQKFNAGSWSLLGGAPTINIDVSQTLQDGSTNLNSGRPFVSSTAGGTGSSSVSERKSMRASAYAELRFSDFLEKGFLTKLLGRHRFNLLGSEEIYDTSKLGWNRYANDNAWDAFATSTTGYSNLFSYRAPVALTYLGQSLKGSSSAAGARIDPIGSRIKLNDGAVYLFNSKWNNSSVAPTAAWSVPASNVYLNQVFNASLVSTQASNPANYIGWGNSTPLNTLSFEEGEPLYTSASKSQREIKSLAGTWQGYLWNDSIVPTLGWRFDEVRTRSINASPDNKNKGYLKLDTASYSLPVYKPAGTYKGHSLSGGAVVHLNQAVPQSWDKLPFNISLTYNNSENFQAQSARVDLYGNPITNPAGKTIDYGVLLATKDNRFSLRVTQYKTKVTNATVSTDSGFTGPILQGLKFRNVFLYRMTGYTWDTRRPYGDTGPTYNNRNFWTQAYLDSAGRPVQTVNYQLSSQYGTSVPSTSVKLETPAEAAQHRDASIKAWNDIQGWLTQKGFFSAWGFNPTTLSALTDRATYEASLDAATNLPKNSQYLPDLASVANYGSITPSGYAITGDSESKGYEFELNANVTKNWRLAFNASQTNAITTNIGGAALQELVDYLDVQMAGVAGDMRQYNGDYVANNEVRKNWSNWRAGYTLLKLQEQTDASELRKWRFNVVSNYSFTHGWLKGAGLGGAYRWQDKVVLGYPVYTDSKGFAAYDLSKPYFGPSEAGLDLWASYEHKLGKKLRWKIQLNVSNSFEKNGLIPTSIEPDGQTWAGVRMKPVQEFALTNSFSF